MKSHINVAKIVQNFLLQASVFAQGAISREKFAEGDKVSKEFQQGIWKYREGVGDNTVYSLWYTALNRKKCAKFPS